MKNSFLWFAILCLSLVAAAAEHAAPPPQNAASEPLVRWMIEDGDSRDPNAYYDEKPPFLERSYDKATQADRSLHFITGTTHASGYITKFHWPEAKNFSAIAEAGVLSLDLWIKNPGDLHEGDSRVFDVTLGSRSNEQFTSWYIATSLLKAQTWNRIALRLAKGQATLDGSSVNGVAIGSDAASSVVNGNVDWSRVDYSRLALLVAAPVEGYLDNMLIESSDAAARPHKTITLSRDDPTPHLQEARALAAPNIFSPRYDIPPTDVRADAFFKDDLLKWDKAAGWQADFYGCENEVFALSSDQMLRGAHNVKIEMKAIAPDARVVLRPPAPIRLEEPFDILDCWIYGNYNSGTVLGLSFQLPDGNSYKWTGGTNTYVSPGYLFDDWSMAHIALPRVFPKGTTLTAIEFHTARPGQYLFHIDQMRALNFRQHLQRTPAPVYKNIGAEIPLPVQDSGACPQSAEAVKTIFTLSKSEGVLTYIAPGGEKIAYRIAPQAGTLSDLTVVVTNGKGETMHAFKPAAGSAPVFEINDKTVSVRDAKVKLLTQRNDGAGLVYSWEYSLPGGVAHVEYRFSLRGKTLAIDVASLEANVSHWAFGAASGLKNPKVVEVPFMLNGPNVLCDGALFTTYFPDWYHSNVSVLPYVAGNEVQGDTAKYTYPDTGYEYWPRTDGKRYPLRERFYITSSTTLEDCLPSISNPPSPLKETLSKRLYKMISPIPDWPQIVKANAALWDKYGLTNLYVLFHAGLWSNHGGRGPEPWHSRLDVSVATPGGKPAVTELFRYLKSKGMAPGYYGGFDFYEPISRIWNYNDVAIRADGSWPASWVQAYHMKTWKFADLAATFATTQAQEFGPDVIYEDGWTSHRLFELNDYDHRLRGSGRMVDSLRGFAAGFRNLRRSAGGPVFSEGNGSNFFTAGLDDGDYGKLKGFAGGQSPDKRRPELFVDFALRKIHPLHATISLDIGYGLFAGVPLDGGDHQWFHHFLAAQIAFGTVGMLEPYSEIYADPTRNFQWTLASYFMMQQLQQRFIMEPVAEIKYFDGNALVSSSRAVASGKYKDNMVFIRYRNGLEIFVNCNWDGKNWMVEDGGQKYELPPGGWLARQGNDFLEYSALENGRRVDFVDSPEYSYLDGHGQTVSRGGLTTDKIAIRHKTGARQGTILFFPE